MAGQNVAARGAGPTAAATALSPPARSTRSWLLGGWLLIALVAALLLGESFLPGQVFLPLALDDFPDWAAGREPDDLLHHSHPNWCMSDVLHLLLPGLATTQAAFQRGELPLWDPSQALGVPHIDEVHFGVYYPPAWLPLVFGLRGLGLMAWLHLVVAGCGMLGYLGALKRSPPAALLGAFAFAFSAWMTARLHAFPVVGAACWLPWILWGLQSGAERGTRLGYVVAALATTLSLLAGFPQVAMLGLLLAGLLELVRALVGLRARRAATPPARGSEAHRWLARALRAAGAVLVGLLLAAPQLLPTLDYMREQSARQEQAPEIVAADAMDLPFLAHLLAPDYYATSGLPGRHPLAAQDSLRARSQPLAQNRAETSMGIGVLGLLLALGALVFGRSWTTRCYSGVALAVFVLLFWPAALEFVARVLPPLRVGSPRRLLVLSTFALAVLAAGGLDLVRKQRLATVALCWVASLVATCVLLVLLVGVPSTEESLDVDAWAAQLAEEMDLGNVSLEQIYAVVSREDFVTAASAAAGSAVLALAAALAAVLLLRPRSAPTERGWDARIERMGGLLPVLLLVELLLSAWPMLRAAPADGVTADASTSDVGRLRVPALASAARSIDPEALVPPRIWRVGNDPSWLRPNFPGLFGLHDVQAYAPMLPLRTAELVSAVAPGTLLSGSILGGVLEPGQLERPAVDMLGVAAVYSTVEGEPPRGFAESERVGHVRVLRNLEALPRAYVVSRLHVVPFKGQRLERLAGAAFDPRSTAILGEAPPGALAGVEVFTETGSEGKDGLVLPPLPEDWGPREVSVLEYAPGRLHLSVAAGAPGLLVVSESWHPGWVARVGGRELPTLVADHALIGVPLADTGALEVELAFEPAVHRVGAGLGLAGLLLLVGGVLCWSWLGGAGSAVGPPGQAHSDAT